MAAIFKFKTTRSAMLLKKLKVGRRLEASAVISLALAILMLHPEGVLAQEAGPGFYPTYSDTLYEGGFNGHTGDYSRSAGGSLTNAGPDQVSVTSSGLWDYDDPQPNFYQRNDTLFKPIDSVFGLFANHELAAFETPDNHTGVAELDVQAPFGLTRNFDPERAHAKLGPAYLDVLYVGAGVIFSDYQGTPPPATDDGWISIVELGLRGAARLTDSLYLVASVNFYYLPFEDQFGVDLSGGNGGALFRVGYEFQTGEWDWLAYNQFQGYAPFYDLFDNLERGALDEAGRYRFGSADRRRQSTRFFDEDFVSFVNTLGLRGTAPVFDNQWRLTTEAFRRDSWNTLDFVEHQDSYQFEALLGYEGNDFWLNPYFRYAASAYDDFETIFHRIYAGVNGRLSENVTLQAEGGYLWVDGLGSGEDSWLWSVGLQHQICEPTFHGVRFGQDYAESLIGDVLVSDFVQYYLHHRIGPRMHSSFFAQYAENDVLRPIAGNNETLSVGGGLTFLPGDFTSVELRAYYQELTNAGGGLSGADYTSWVYRASIVQQLFSRTSATAEYQFEDVDGNSQDFDEHYVRFGLRTYF